MEWMEKFFAHFKSLYSYVSLMSTARPADSTTKSSWVTQRDHAKAMQWWKFVSIADASRADHIAAVPGGHPVIVRIAISRSLAFAAVAAARSGSGAGELPKLSWKRHQALLKSFGIWLYVLGHGCWLWIKWSFGHAFRHCPEVLVCPEV